MDRRIDQLINRTLDSTAGRIVWALLSVGVIYACAWLLASLIGGPS